MKPIIINVRMENNALPTHIEEGFRTYYMYTRSIITHFIKRVTTFRTHSNPEILEAELYRIDIYFIFLSLKYIY